MNPDTDSELAAVREFRAALDEPRDGALARGRWQLARTDSPQRPRQRRTWILATAGAALAVAVVVGGAASIQRPGPGPGGTAAAPGASVSQSPPQSSVDLPATRGTRAPLNPAVTGKPGANRTQAVEALTRLAAKQADAPIVVGPNEVLYVKTYNLRDDAAAYLHEFWLDVTIGFAVRIRRSDGGAKGVDHVATQQELDEFKAYATGTPPSLDNMNAAYVTAFPAGADQAHQLAASWKSWAQQEYPGRDLDALIWKHLHEVFHYVEPRLTAAQRSAFYLALLDLSNVAATTATIDGKQYDVVCRPSAWRAAECVLFDPVTGRFVGEATTGVDMVVKASGFQFVDVGVQPRPAVGAPVVTEKKDRVSGSATKPKR